MKSDNCKVDSLGTGSERQLNMKSMKGRHNNSDSINQLYLKFRGLNQVLGNHKNGISKLYPQI